MNERKQEKRKKRKKELMNGTASDCISARRNLGFC